jgi:hypothetical protein
MKLDECRASAQRGGGQYCTDNIRPTAASARESHNGAAHAIYQRYQDLKWEKLLPELGAGSAEITILMWIQNQGRHSS